MPTLRTWSLIALAALTCAPGPADRPTGRRAARTEITARSLADTRSAEAARAKARHGIVLGVYSDHDGRRYRKDLAEIRALGADSVLIIVQQAMTDVRADKISPRRWLTPSDRRLERVLAEAGRLGLSITLMPTLFVEETTDGEWRGAIEPRDWDRWWREYADFILHYARMAERHGVVVFSVGSELCSTETHRARWADLILRVRRTTPSLVTYSFNWDHLTQGNIADLLDLAGTNAYYDLATEDGATAAELAEAWREHLPGLADWSRGHGRPILFTEVGYRSVVGAQTSPWNYVEELDYDGIAQSWCYEAFLATWAHRDDVAGIYFYSWRGDGGTGDTTYSPRGKPAEQVLRRWFRGDAFDVTLEDAHEQSDGSPVVNGAGGSGATDRRGAP